MKGYIHLALAAILVFSFASCKKVVLSCLGVSSNVVKVGEAVSFTNCSTNGETYIWSFGDGTTSTEENPTHTYMRVGVYEVTLSVASKKDKKSDKQTLTVTVVPNTNNANNGVETYKVTFLETTTQRYFDGSTYRDTIIRDTIVDDVTFAYSEDGSTMYTTIQTIFGSCPVDVTLDGDNFSLPAQSPFLCEGIAWNGLNFGGFSGSFTNYGSGVNFSYNSSQNLGAEESGTLDLEISGIGLRYFN